MQRSKYFFLVLAGVASATAFAQSAPESGVAGAASPSTAAGPEPRIENDVKYVCGGIGTDEVASLQDAAKDYDLMMTFAASTGAFLADVDVEIADARGRSVLNVTCDGPIMIVDLPRDGRYRVRAETGGRTLIRTAQVRERGNVQRIRMAWPVQTVDMGISPSTRPDQTDAGATGSGSSGEGTDESRTGSGAR
jgi:hypothetical protein